MASQHVAPKRETISVPTQDLYNAWSCTYDAEPSPLVQLDSKIFRATIPSLLLLSTSSSTSSAKPLTVLDLGCGTGRNSAVVYSHLAPGSRLVCVDFSAGMLARAQARFSTLEKQEKRGIAVEWVHANLDAEEPWLWAVGLGLGMGVDVVVCTLVLEHLKDLARFFERIGGVVKEGGWAWVTGMHPDLEGRGTRAGFRTVRAEGRDGSGGSGGRVVKVCGESVYHGIEDICAAAAKAGWRLEGEVGERKDEGDDGGENQDAVRCWVGMRFVKQYCVAMGR